VIVGFVMTEGKAENTISYFYVRRKYNYERDMG